MINGGASLAWRTHRDLEELGEVNLVAGNEENKVAKEVQTGGGVELGASVSEKNTNLPAQQVYFLIPEAGWGVALGWFLNWLPTAQL